VNDTEARQTIATAFSLVAPDIDLDDVDPGAELRVETDLDSMDFLELIEVISTRIGRDIPERDYPRTATLDDFADYLVTTTGG
jgi:acyl carrier protein